MRSALALLAALAAVAAAPAGAAARVARCPSAPTRASLPSAAALRQMNAFVARLRARPTGSPAQARYIDWIRRRLRAIPGVHLREQRFRINRWNTTSSRLVAVVGGRRVTLPVASAVPYSKPTGPAGASAPVTVVPAADRITRANAAGRIVVRAAPAGRVPLSVFGLPVIGWSTYDPGHTIRPTGAFLGDFIAYNDRVKDLRDAGAAGARGILFVKDLPRGQLIGHYEPYEGTAWKVPGLFLGADEGRVLTDALAAGTPVSAAVVVRASFRHVVTRSLLATIRGASPRRIVIDSHTDGTNAVEDNGPVAMVAMARFLASLPARCRPRTIELAFSTAHFYQRVARPSVRDGGAEQLAEQLDRDYAKGTVSVVLAIEHLGARDYEEVPRAGGRPGHELRPNGQRAIQFIGVTPSPPLVAAVSHIVRAYGMRRSVLLRGSDTPGPTVPAHCSFGGEGTPYERHLLPTVGVISAPQYLYDPAFELAPIDFGVMRSEVAGYTALVLRLGRMSQAAIAGGVTKERSARAQGAPGCPPEL